MKKEVDMIIEQIQYKQDYLAPDEYLVFLISLLEAIEAEVAYAEEQL